MDYAEVRDQIVTRRPELDIAKVDAAFEFAERAHRGQLRYSGEPYINHPVAATAILLDLHPDLEAIQACLLHDVTEDTPVELQEVEARFGPVVTRLVEGLEKLAVVKVPSEAEDEKWNKMFLAMASDIRIVFIKLADRLHNMRTLSHVPEEKRQRIAHETLVVHAAIASRLGIYQIKSELEDLCFRYLEPGAFEAIQAKVAGLKQRSEGYMAFARAQVEQLLNEQGIVFKQVQGRTKHLWSIHEKLARKDTDDLNAVYDVFAIRVILPDKIRDGKELVSHLYEVLGLLHNHYLPLQDRFKDYVAVPKPNGYRSLHTTVLGLGGELYEEPTEIQIRTESMHRESEIGIASHSEYKQGHRFTPLNRQRHFELHNALGKLHALVERQPDLEPLVKPWVESYQFMSNEDRGRVEELLRERGLTEQDLDRIRKGRSQENFTLKPKVEQQLAWLRGLANGSGARVELDLYPNKIFVLTPSSDVKELPKGATPIDFAYAVHTEVGHKMVHAKVNGRIVPLDYVLKNGDVVAIGTRTNARPSRYWLSVVKSASARTKIRNWFNRQDRESNVAAGRDMLNRQLALLGKPLLDDKLTLLKQYAGKHRTLPEREQFLESIGLGSVSASQIVKGLFSELVSVVNVEPKREESDLTDIQLSREVLVTGEEDLPVILSACCKPRPPHAIIAYVTRGRAIRVHRQSCRELGGLEGERFVSAHWKAKP